MEWKLRGKLVATDLDSYSLDLNVLYLCVEQTRGGWKYYVETNSRKLTGNSTHPTKEMAMGRAELLALKLLNEAIEKLKQPAAA